MDIYIYIFLCMCRRRETYICTSMSPGDDRISAIMLFWVTGSKSTAAFCIVQVRRCDNIDVGSCSVVVVSQRVLAWLLVKLLSEGLLVLSATLLCVTLLQLEPFLP